MSIIGGYLSDCHLSFSESVRRAFSPKIACLTNENCLSYFNRELLTPAEFLNSLSIKPFFGSLRSPTDRREEKGAALSFRFVDSEEFFLYGHERTKNELFRAVVECAPGAEALRALESVG